MMERERDFVCIILHLFFSFKLLYFYCFTWGVDTEHGTMSALMLSLFVFVLSHIAFAQIGDVESFELRISDRDFADSSATVTVTLWFDYTIYQMDLFSASSNLTNSS